jgi:hypothetical protein
MPRGPLKPETLIRRRAEQETFRRALVAYMRVMRISKSALVDMSCVQYKVISNALDPDGYTPGYTRRKIAENLDLWELIQWNEISS